MDSSDDQAASIEASSESFLPEADDIIEASWAANEHSKFITYKQSFPKKIWKLFILFNEFLYSSWLCPRNWIFSKQGFCIA